MQKITPFLWFDKEAGEAAKFYTSVFEGSKIKDSTTLHDTPSGTVEIVTVELFDQEFTLMSAGPLFKFNEAISFVVHCDTQEEIDDYWKKLSAVPEAEQCGWLKDKYGLSWQIVPREFEEMMQGDDPVKVQRMIDAMMQMQRLDLGKLRAAYEGA